MTLGWRQEPRGAMSTEYVLGRALMARQVAAEGDVTPELAHLALERELDRAGRDRQVTLEAVSELLDAAVAWLRGDRREAVRELLAAEEPYAGWDGLDPPDYEPPVTAGRRYILTRGGTFVDSVCVKTDGYMPGVAEFEHNIRIDLTGWVVKDRGPA